MGCTKCESIQGRCDCCYYVDGDETFKAVVYCPDCKAYICKNCKNNWFKRSEAYLKRKVEGIKKLLSKK